MQLSVITKKKNTWVTKIQWIRNKTKKLPEIRRKTNISNTKTHTHPTILPHCPMVVETASAAATATSAVAAVVAGIGSDVLAGICNWPTNQRSDQLIFFETQWIETDRLQNKTHWRKHKTQLTNLSNALPKEI